MHNALVYGIKWDRHLYFNNKSVELSDSEYRVMRYLMEHPNHAVKHKDISDQAVGDSNREEDVCKHYSVIVIKRLRTKISKIGINPNYIKSVRGIGYMLDERRFHYMRTSLD